MLSVKNLAGQVEGLTDTTGFEHVEEVNGELSLTFSAYRSERNIGYDLLNEESVITYENRDYRIKNMQSYKDYKQVDALSIYFDNADVWHYDIFGGTHTFNEFMDFVLSGTGWTYTNVDITGSAFIPNFGNANVLTLNEALISAFDCEMQVGQGRHLIFAYELGGDNDSQYRYGHNIVALSKSVDTSNLKTYIKGYGLDGLEVSYTSPNAVTFGIRHAEPIHDDNFSVAADLIALIKKDLVDYPETSIELDAVELQDKTLGEKVWLIYEPLNIEFQTRVLSKTTRLPKELSTVVIGTALRKTLSDSLVSQNIEVSDNKKQTRSRIDQTNEMITLEVERVDESIASLVIQADSIELSVSSLNGQVSNNTAQISIQAGQISSKVSQTDYNGNTIASLINQTSTTIDIIASKINLVGAVSVLSDISGSLGSITAGSITGTSIRGGEFILDGGTLDLRLGNILWGTNVPQASYAENAGNANTLNGSYTASSFSLNGHTHSGSEYVKSNSGQVITLGAGASTLNVYLNGSLQGTISYN
jgi:hypothetical protein